MSRTVLCLGGEKTWLIESNWKICTEGYVHFVRLKRRKCPSQKCEVGKVSARDSVDRTWPKIRPSRDAILYSNFDTNLHHVIDLLVLRNTCSLGRKVFSIDNSSQSNYLSISHAHTKNEPFVQTSLCSAPFRSCQTSDGISFKTNKSSPLRRHAVHQMMIPN